MIPFNTVSLESEFEKIIDGILTQGYGFSDAIVTPDDVLALNEAFDFRKSTGQFASAAVGQQAGKQVLTEIRGDQICWLPEEGIFPGEALYVSKIQALIEYFNRTCFLGLQDAELHYAEYPVGAFYKRHLDRFRTDSRRKLSVICYLNQQWEPTDGGQLILFPNPARIESILPLGGRLVCFESDVLEHEVLQAQRPRRSLTGWLRTR
ncbi:2OG-Fe(II) oxygenase [Arundinibacter roseus]|uniref:2OG-Fe(II) oxygenase n=1 Tax=Arundinibacter roseus TaxID=2070510 RepID=UPI001E2AA2CE|nr:2OG-Fe(II) oxygenase [Arundinibacter roseus]